MEIFQDLPDEDRVLEDGRLRGNQPLFERKTVVLRGILPRVVVPQHSRNNP